MLVVVYEIMSTRPPFSQHQNKHLSKRKAERPYRVVVLDDPVNLLGYITFAFSKVFGYSRAKSSTHVSEIRRQGQSTLWTGTREKAELYVYMLQEWQLNAYLKRDEYD